jgi:hypothetical protein
MGNYGGMDVHVCAFLTSALDGGGWSASRPGHLALGGNTPGTHWIECWWTPESISTLKRTRVIQLESLSLLKYPSSCLIGNSCVHCEIRCCLPGGDTIYSGRCLPSCDAAFVRISLLSFLCHILRDLCCCYSASAPARSAYRDTILVPHLPFSLLLMFLYPGPPDFPLPPVCPPIRLG